MIHSLLRFCLALLFLLPVSGYAAESFPAHLNLAGQSLVRNGQGVRTKLFFDLYTAGLYLQNMSTDPAAILASEQPMAMRLEITSSMITSEKMEEAVREGFQRSTTDPAIQPRIEQFITVFKETIKEGDIYDFLSWSGDTLIFKNGKHADVIAGADFRQALFGIWLGADPVQASLKSELLGQSHPNH